MTSDSVEVHLQYHQGTSITEETGIAEERQETWSIGPEQGYRGEPRLEDIRVQQNWSRGT